MICGVLILFLAISVIAPVCAMFTRITPSGIAGAFSSPQFSAALSNSLVSSGITAVISVLLALAASICTERTDLRFRRAFRMIFTLPMLIPSISHAFGLVALFGANGIITRFLGTGWSIYGMAGIICGGVMYSFPAAYIMISGVMRYEDGSQHRAAEVLGVPAIRRFTGLTIPFLMRPAVSAFFAVFTMAITDYGVPLMIGGKTITLSVLMYNKAVGMMDYVSGSVIGAVLLVPAVAAFIADISFSESGRNANLPESVNNYRVKAPSFVFCIGMSAVIIAPVLVFCLMTFARKYPADMSFTLYHAAKSLRRGAGQYLLNSVMYSVFAGLFGTVLAFICSYISSRLGGKFSRILHFMSLVTMAVPGITLGLSYVIFFSRSSIYGTVLVVIIADIAHFFASPYIMMVNALRKVTPSLEDTGSALGIPRVSVITDVIIPEVMPILRGMFTYFFVNSMMTISAVSFLAPPSPKPAALMIPQFEAQLLMESAAFVSVLILGVNVALKALIDHQQ